MYNRRSAAKRAIQCSTALLILTLMRVPAIAQSSPPAIVSHVAYAAGAATTHTTAAFDSTGSSLLVALVSSHPTWNGQPVTFSSVTDSASNEWKVLVGPTSYSGSGGYSLTYPLISAIYYVNAPKTSANDTITVTLTNSAPLVIHAFAVSGSDTSGPPIYSPIADSGATPTTDVTTADITVPLEALLLAWAKNESGFTAMAQDAWTLDTLSARFLAAESMTATTEGNYHAHFTYGTPDGWQAAVIGVKSASPYPVAQNLTVTTSVNTPVAITLSATSPSGASLAYTVLSRPSNGQLTGTPPNLTYTPTADFIGSDSFTYKANDGTFDSNTATVSITVKGPNHPPVAYDASVTAAAGTTTPITLTATDPDNDPLTYSIVTGPSHGTMSGTAPNLNYTPAQGYYGGDSFSFKANDSQADSNVATISITVTAVIVPPTLMGRMGYAGGANTTHTTTAFSTVGSTLLMAFVSATSPWNGATITINSVSDNQGNTWNTLVGPTAYAGTGSYGLLSGIYYVNAPKTSATHKVTVALSPAAPLVIHVFAVSGTNTTAVPIYSAITDSGATKSSDVTSADITVPVNTLLLGWSKNEGSGTAAAQDSWTLDVASASYLWAEYMTAPASGAYHSHFLYTSGPNGWQTAVVGAKPLVAGPEAQNLTVTATENTPVAITLSATSPSGATLTYDVLTQPSNGQLTGTPPNLTYTPNTDYLGSDSFTYKANDGTFDSNTATVSITVKAPNHPPVAYDASVTAAAGTTTPITLTATDPDNDPLTYSVVSGPLHGTLSGTAPNLNYTPAAGYFGDDSFSFKTNDGQADSNVATISITVKAVIVPPTITGRVSYAGGSNTTHTTTAFSTVGSTLLVAFVSATSPWNGATITINSVSDSQGNTWNTLVGPTAYAGTGSYGLLSGIYYVNAPKTSATHKVTVALSPAAPLVIHVFAVSGTDTTVTPIYSAIANSGATKSSNVTSADITVPVNTLLLGWSKNEGSGTAVAQDSWILDVASASYLWAEYMTAPASGAYHSHFLYTSGPNGWQTAIVGAKPMLIHPEADNLSVTTEPNMSVAITLSGTSPYSTSLNYTVQTPGPTHGTLAGTAPNLTYTPETDYVGADSFTYIVNDGTSDSAPATVSITVSSSNHVPVANDQSLSTNEDTPLNITLTATDADNNTLTYNVVSDPAHGSLSGTAPNLTYTPAAGYYGSDSFTFKVNDGTVDSNTATVSIMVNHVNHQPVANNQSVTASQDTALNITFTATDADNDPLTYAVVTPPAHGSLSGTAPNLTYTPAAGYYGPDSFTFKASDGQADSNTATVSITVVPATNTTVGSSLDPSLSGQTVTFTATVVSAAGTPTGTVIFKDGTSTLATIALNAGAASYSSSALSVGSHSITASYGGASGFLPSTSEVLVQVVQASTTTGLAASPSQSTYGQPVNFTATVSSTAGGVPTGTVTFQFGGTILGTSTLNASGQAAFPTSTLPVGSDVVVAAYGGDTYHASSQGSYTQNVSRASTTTTVTSSANPSTVGQPVTLTAKVSSAGGIPTGSINFKLGNSTKLAVVPLDSTGTATLTLSTLPAGTDTINAAYSGDANFLASAGSYRQTVNDGLSTATTVTSSLNPSHMGDLVTFTATVTTSNGGVPTGTVSFSASGTSLATVTLDASGQASYATSSIPAGTTTITAVYSGNSTYNSSRGSVVQVVNTTSLQPTTTTLTSSPNPVSSSHQISFTAVVSSGTSTIPTGTVIFVRGTVAIGTVVLDSTGKASLRTKLPPGTYTVTAVYSGDATFAGSTSAPLIQVVN